MTLADWKAVWASTLPGDGRTCTQLFNDIINTNSNGLYQYNPQLFNRVNENMTFMLSKYFNSGRNGNLVLPGEPGWNDFQFTLVQACRNIPGSCSTAQTLLCDGCSRAQIANNPDLLTLCGCYPPKLDPKIYTRDVPIECDPLCAQLISAKRITPDTGAVIPCQDTVCVMDNISITAAKSSVDGISITQVCPGCNPQTGCICIFDVSVATLSDNLGLTNPDVFRQYCPASTSTCLEIDSIKQTSTVVPCGDYFPGAISATVTAPISVGVYVLLILIIVIVLLSLAVYVYTYSDLNNAVSQLEELGGAPMVSSSVA
jgi:hypothetical protein